MSNVLSSNITTSELITLDYRYNYSEQELLADWHKLISTTYYKSGSQFKPGLKLCQHYCSNFWDIQSAAGKSFNDAWTNYEIMDKVRKWGLVSMDKLWMSWIRRAVYMCAGLPNSSFYRPHFAKQLIQSTNKARGTLYDPCAGWGGRMLGTLAGSWNYVGCEPNVTTYNNLIAMREFVHRHANSRASLYNIPAEQHDYTERVDIILTSPPYYNLEVYTSDSNQSYVKYDNYDSWRDDWLRPLIKKCINMLAIDGISAWNVMNVGKHNLVTDVINAHAEMGYELYDTMGFTSPLSNIRTLKNKDVTYCFRKSCV